MKLVYKHANICLVTLDDAVYKNTTKYWNYQKLLEIESIAKSDNVNKQV